MIYLCFYVIRVLFEQHLYMKYISIIFRGSMKDYAGSRSLRKKKSKVYVDGLSSSDEDDPMQTFDPEEKIKSKNFPPYFITELKGEEVTFELFQRIGFNNPIFVKEKTGLDIRVPDASFSVTDVRNLVGGKRLLEVMNCATQLNAEMTLKDFEEFFQDPDRDDTKLNVISLEFSHTRLDGHVTAPKVVRQIDFTDNAWPRHLKDLQDDSTNDMNKMQYPKIQKYCLMSIEGCYTDFHVDLGGTSVWYHLLRGQKMFWLIPPTAANLKAFENWTLSGKQGEVFFGDMVEKCGRVILNPGNTFFIPSGWIHAVYTPVDSLVFGGNYIHSFAMERQIRIAQVEETLKVPQKFRFPFFNEMLWSMLDKYCYALLGRHHLNFDDTIIQRLLGSEEERKTFQENIGHPHITQAEVRGLRATVLYLHSQSSSKKNVPTFIKDPVALIKDIRIIVEVHKNDRPERALNGRPIIYWQNVRKDQHLFTKVKRVKKATKWERAERIDNGSGNLYLDPSLVCSYCRLDGWFVQPDNKVCIIT
jgi:F-box/leucine-rich repeat protein 10/11